MPFLARYRAIVFDLDGTLIDSYEALTEAVNFALGEEGHRLVSAGELRHFVGEGVERLLQKCLGQDEIPDRILRNFEERYGVVCREKTKLLASVASTLPTLANLGLRMAICTNKPTRFAVDIAEHMGFAAYFDGIVGPDLAGFRKPDPVHVLKALETTGVAREHAVFIGDMPIDVQGARSAGIDVACIPTGSASIDGLRASGPDYLLERFDQIVDLVEGRLGRATANAGREPS